MTTHPDVQDRVVASVSIVGGSAEIYRRGPWRNIDAVEFATLARVDWCHCRRLFEAISHIPPAAAEANFYAALDQPGMAA